MKEPNQLQAKRPAPSTELMTPDEVAAYLGVERQTIYNWRTLGTGPDGFRMNNGRLRYWRSEIERWLRDQMELEKEKQR